MSSVTFVFAVLAIVIGVSALSHVLNRRRYSGVTSTARNLHSPAPQFTDHPLHDRLLDN
jgi:hypothetical protein